MFDNRHVKVMDKDTDATLLEGTIEDRLYSLSIDVKKEKMKVLSMEKSSLELWHRRLGYLNPREVNKLTQEKLIYITDSVRGILKCESCIVSCRDQSTVYTTPLEILFIDIPRSINSGLQVLSQSSGWSHELQLALRTKEELGNCGLSEALQKPSRETNWVLD